MKKLINDFEQPEVNLSISVKRVEQLGGNHHRGLIGQLRSRQSWFIGAVQRRQFSFLPECASTYPNDLLCLLSLAPIKVSHNFFTSRILQDVTLGQDATGSRYFADNRRLVCPVSSMLGWHLVYVFMIIVSQIDLK